ncbi:MAG TPA: histidinol dehydrogenase [Terriglobales bacterium]|nr:histidinol dehydrogenase [Terriglobales bacterium]
MRIIKGRAIAAQLKNLESRRLLFAAQTERVVARIVRDVRSQGDVALRRYAERLDGLSRQQPFRVTQTELQRALTSVNPEFRRALESASRNIRQFADWQKPQEFLREVQPGISVGQVIRPLESVGCYVPGGRYPLPSSLLMTVIPAQVAGVGRIAVASPRPALETLAAAALLGVNEFYAIGGAQAIAALAYGTRSIPAVRKIVGPGNRFVTTAKKLVAFDCAIDFLAGPTETVLVSDTGTPAFIAADMLAQSEHDPDARAVFITSRPDLAKALAVELKKGAQTNSAAAQSLARNGLIFLTGSPAASMEVANAIASEHLTVAEAQLGDVRNAGSIFIGDYTAQALGDYASGPNHVLPTAGAARFRGGLSVLDFLKIVTVQQATSDGIRSLAPVVETLARAEGLQAHADSVRVRCSRA